MLRVHECCFCRADAEKISVELIHVFQNRARLYVVSIVEHGWVDAGGCQFFIGKIAQRLDTVLEIAPELVKVLSPRKSAGHTYDRDAFQIYLSSPI